MDPSRRYPEPELQIVETPQGPTPEEVNEKFWKEEFAINYEPEKSLEETLRKVRKKWN